MTSPPSPGSPEVTVAAVAESDGRFLLVEERINRRLLLNQPAGHVEPGETLLAAVAREAHEETAWHFEPQALLGVYLWRHPTNGRSFLRFAFTGPLTRHDASQRLDHGIVGTHWLTRTEIGKQPSRLRSPLVLRCVDDYLAGQGQSLHPVAQLDLRSAASLGGGAVLPPPGGLVTISL